MWRVCMVRRVGAKASEYLPQVLVQAPHFAYAIAAGRPLSVQHECLLPEATRHTQGPSHCVETPSIRVSR